MHQSRIFDIILIGLAVVILVHLFLNNSLFDERESKTKEHMMNNINFPSMHDIYDKIIENSQPREKRRENRDDAHSVSRDNGYIEQTDKNITPYYHVVNKTVTNNSVNSDDEIELSDSTAHSDVRDIRDIRDNRDVKASTCSASSDSKYVTEHEYAKYADNKKLVFVDNYEGRLTSDPFDADAIQVNESGIDLKGFLGNNPLEELVDVNGNTCELNEETAHLKRYIREYVLDGRSQCYCATDKTKSAFTRNEIDQYRDQHIGFRDKINGTSSADYDPVDKMNEISMVGIKANNQSIADFYDSIVDNKYNNKGESQITNRVSNLNGSGFIMGTSIPHNNCINPPEFDLKSAVPQGNYTQSSNSGGRYFLRDNWMYANENPNNGGTDHTGIRGSDPMSDDSLLIS